MADKTVEPVVDLCKICAKHGRILMPDGFCSIEFASSGAGQGCVENMVSAGFLTSAQARELLSNIRSLNFPAVGEAVEPGLRHMLEIWNTACWPDARYNGTPDAIHEAQEQWELLEPIIALELEKMTSDTVLVVDMRKKKAKKPH